MSKQFALLALALSLAACVAKPPSSPAIYSSRAPEVMYSPPGEEDDGLRSTKIDGLIFSYAIPEGWHKAGTPSGRIIVTVKREVGDITAYWMNDVSDPHAVVQAQTVRSDCQFDEIIDHKISSQMDGRCGMYVVGHYAFKVRGTVVLVSGQWLAGWDSEWRVASLNALLDSISIADAAPVLVPEDSADEPVDVYPPMVSMCMSECFFQGLEIAECECFCGVSDDPSSCEEEEDEPEAPPPPAPEATGEKRGVLYSHLEGWDEGGFDSPDNVVSLVRQADGAEIHLVRWAFQSTTPERAVEMIVHPAIHERGCEMLDAGGGADGYAFRSVSCPDGKASYAYAAMLGDTLYLVRAYWPSAAAADETAFWRFVKSLRPAP